MSSKNKKANPPTLSFSEEEKLTVEKRKQQSQEALIFYQENKVPQAMQLVLNQMFLQQPKDVYGYVSRFFSSRALAPSIHHFECSRTIDANCSPATKVSLFGTIKGECELIAESAVSDNFGSNEQVLVDESIKGNLTQSKSSITSSKHNLGESPSSTETATPSLADHSMSNREIVKRFNASLAGKELAPLQECLELITATSVSLPHLPQSSMLLALSQSVISGLSNATETPVYDVIAGDPVKLTVPHPMFHMLNGTGGKCKLADFFISISPNVATLEGLKYAQTLYDKLKHSVKLSSPLETDGAVRYNIDKLEQGMELLAEAGKGLELSMGEDVFVFVNADAGTRWDSEKNKYEANSGQWKASAELVEFYNELIKNYPSVILGIFNAFHEADTSGYCAISKMYPSMRLFLNNSDSIQKMQTELRKKEEQSEDRGNANSLVLSKRIELPLHSWIEDARKGELTNELGFAFMNNPQTEVCDSFYVDLVTGLGGSFIQTGSPRDKGTSLYLSRILDISEELKNKKRLTSNKKLIEIFTKHNSNP